MSAVKDEFTSFRIYAKNARRNSKLKHLDYNLTPQYLKRLWEKQEGKCSVSGIQLIHNESKWLYNQASLDRIDNNKGYIVGNVRFITLMGNYALHKFTDGDLIEFCREVTKHNS